VTKPLIILYTNHKGETRVRTITPERVFWGSNEFHPERQWLLSAFEKGKGQRTFAMKDMASPEVVYRTRLATLEAVAQAIDGECSSGWLRDKAGIDASHEGCNLALAIMNPIAELREELEEAKALLQAFRDAEDTDPETGPCLNFDALHAAFDALGAKGHEFLIEVKS
jgi:hypothetical protein